MMNERIYSVLQVNRFISQLLHNETFLRNLSVSGEVSNCKYHPSGHIYFTIKDGDSSLNAVMFASSRKGLNFQMRNGDHVVVKGSVEVYEKTGVYQVYAREIRKAGVGELYLKFEALKQELEEMGMFSPEYKKPIPKYATRIGVVTASTGAAIQDIRNIAGRRNPYVQIILYPALVQGEGAAQSIVNGIHALDQMGLDILIVGRGGGSIEDLWAFNEEIVARAVFECETPVISAVGHETDTTIIDYVSDRRAPTPSAAAELAVFDIRAFDELLSGYQHSMGQSMNRQLSLVRQKLEGYQVRMRYLNPKHQVQQKQQYFDQLYDRLQNRMQSLLHEKKQLLGVLAERMEGLSPAKRLQQGYSFVALEDGTTLRSIQQMKIDDKVRIHVTDGELCARVEEIVERTRADE